MAESLDKVLQPDGTYKWQLVELRAENLYEKDKPAPEPEPLVRKTRGTKTDEPPTDTEF